MNRFLLFFVLLMMLVSCSNDMDRYKLIASEKTLPSNFNQTAFQREEVPFFQYEVTKADNQPKYEHGWSLYNLEKEKPTVNFKENSVIFIGLTESGSCPMELSDIEQNSEENAMTILLSESEGPCTADASPRTFVIEVDHETTKKIETITIVKDDIQTAVPIEEPEDS